MSHESRSYIHDLALIQGITLLENAIKRLDSQDAKLATISSNWVKSFVPAISSQVQLIISVSTNDIASKFLVMKLNKLNDHLLSEFKYRPYALRLSREALHAMMRALQARSHIWDQAQLHTIIESLGYSHAVKTKGLPYYDYEKKEEEEENKKKIKILEYKPS